jgi:class 3 adenylate cyclase
VSNAKTVSAKYVFLDIVGFSRNRTVEAQADIISALNTLVLAAVGALGLSDEHLLLLPTGDGICIGILNIEDPFDIHLELALTIIRLLHEYNARTEDARRRFALRFGVNANVDNLVTDIRGDRNVAGAGINIAQRVMSAADANQILVGQSVFDVLSNREKYDRSFLHLVTASKHGARLSVFQFVEAGRPGLNVELPLEFRTAATGEVPLTPVVAHFLAAALRHEALLHARIGLGQNRYAGTAMLYFIAIDAVTQSSVSDARLATARLPTEANATPEEQFSYYRNLSFWTVCELTRLVEHHILWPYRSLFVAHEMEFWFVSANGRRRLQEEYPELLQASASLADAPDRGG